MVDLVELVIAIPAGLLLADFGSGVIHWIIDRYIPGDAPVVGRHFVGLIHQHHERPLALFKLSAFRNNAGFFLLVGTLFAAFWAMGWLNPITIAAFVFGACTNQIHAWAHRRPRQFAQPIRALQSVGALQSPRHHGQHHGPSPTAYYCLLTDWVNPLADRIGLWRRAEALLRIGGLEPQPYVRPNPNYIVG